MKNTVTRRLIGLFDDFGAAFAASAAVRSHRRPADRDLRQLGINPSDFPDMR